MKYRLLIFEDQEDLGRLIKSFLDIKGYEVFTFNDPGECPLDDEKRCPCPIGETCADVILSDMRMPVKTGLDFLEDQISKGCKCKHLALMSGAFTDEEVLKAESLEIKLFKKPFKLMELNDWLDQIGPDIDPERKLADWFLVTREEA